MSYLCEKPDTKAAPLLLEIVKQGDSFEECIPIFEMIYCCANDKNERLFENPLVTKNPLIRFAGNAAANQAIGRNNASNKLTARLSAPNELVHLAAVFSLSFDRPPEAAQTLLKLCESKSESVRFRQMISNPTPSKDARRTLKSYFQKMGLALLTTAVTATIKLDSEYDKLQRQVRSDHEFF